MNTRHQVGETIHDILEQSYIDPAMAQIGLARLIDDALSEKCYIEEMEHLRVHDASTFVHSVNVAVYSGMIGALCHADAALLSLLVSGGLLHDLGKIDVPISILNKPAKLEPEEFACIETHPARGYERLCKMNHPMAREIAMIAAQHHLHVSGAGYAPDVAKHDLTRLSRIVSIADVYDALTARRSYKQAYKPHIAFKIMTRLSRGQFDEELLMQFFNHLAIFPVGSVVETSLGFAIIKYAPFGRTTRPRICVFADERYRIPDSPYEVDLLKNPSVQISSVLEDISLIALVTRLRINPVELLESTYPEKNIDPQESNPKPN